MQSGTTFRPRLLWRFGLVFLALGLPAAEARHPQPRFGWQGATARYTGGYSIGGSVGAAAGPASVRIRAAWDGRSAIVTWQNTFYTSSGRYVISQHWNFLSNGTVTTSTMDPRVRRLPGTGTFVLIRHNPVKFTLADANGRITATGQFRLSGGRSLSITGTLFGLPEGDIPFGFSGSRAR